MRLENTLHGAEFKRYIHRTGSASFTSANILLNDNFSNSCFITLLTCCYTSIAVELATTLIKHLRYKCKWTTVGEGGGVAYVYECSVID